MRLSGGQDVARAPFVHPTCGQHQFTPAHAHPYTKAFTLRYQSRKRYQCSVPHVERQAETGTRRFLKKYYVPYSFETFQTFSERRFVSLPWHLHIASVRHVPPLNHLGFA